ncbi:MAG: hypothetical protein SF052_00540 [Bacteroidia bacterium]|nr:hypothetical protein [Bacteroidia bacterium]
MRFLILFQKNFFPIILLLLLFPLFFINLSGYHGWGDDFAQYIHQAINVTKGVPPAQTGHILNEKGIIGPSAYPMGFPLLLAPVYALWGNNMLFFQYYMTGLLIALGLVCYRFFSRFTSVWLALGGCLWLVYHPWVLAFKADILSEIPYTLFLMAAVSGWLYGNGRHKATKTGLLVGFAILIRPMGVVFLGAIVAEAVLKSLGDIGKKPEERQWKTMMANAGLTVLVALGVYFLVEKILFPMPSEGSYISLIMEHSPAEYFFKNLTQYGKSLEEFVFPAGKNRIAWAGAIIAGVLLLVGIANKWRSYPLPLLMVVIHIIMLGVYPYFQGSRFLFPVIPLVLFYFFSGVNILVERTKTKKFATPVFLGVLLMFYVPSVYTFYKKTQLPITSGPQQKVADETFSYIRQELPPNARILFHKPRALALYSGKSSMFPGYMTPEVMWDFFLTKNMTHFLINEWMETQAERDFMEENGCHLTLIFQNGRYRLYSIDYGDY